MSVYSSDSIKTEIVEPIVHNNNDRSEFSISGDVLPNLRLINLGQVGNAAVEPNDLLGQLSHIKHITLFDGRNVLTQQRNFNDHMAFMNLKHSNAVNHQINRNKLGHSIGYKNFYVGANGATHYTRQTFVSDAINNSLDNADTPQGVKKASINLQDVLNMLNVVPVLSDKVFNQLRLVIEYETDYSKRLNVNNVTNTTATRPLLVVDKVMNDSMSAALRGQISNAQWTEYEQDRIFVDSVAAGTQEISVKVNGYNNKTLERLRISKRYQDNAKNFNGANIRGYGPYQSVLGLREGFNVRPNGRNIMPRSHVEGQNRMLALLSDTYGPLNLKEDDNAYLHSSIPSLSTTKQGQLSFLGLYVGEKIQDLKVSFKRDFEANTDDPAPQNDALRLDLEGEVVKQMEVRNGNYLISYA